MKMFLSQRATQAEYFDLPDRSLEDIKEGYRLLGRVNKFFRFAEPFQRLLPRWLGEEKCRELTILDLGAGDGLLGKELTEWATARGWKWRVVNLELNALALGLTPGNLNVSGSALALPFLDGSFDVVIATQMTHHLTGNEEVTQHFREAWRVSRDGVFIYDLHRHVSLYAVIWVLLLAMRMPTNFRADGLLSVRRGWRVAEWRQIAKAAGIANANVYIEHVARIMLMARKQVGGGAAAEATLAGSWRGDRRAVDGPVVATNRETHLIPPAKPAQGVG